ncbi:hypothetical protein BGZ76_002994 [Entomortierella beljakovae]|nr:hypothetical protein BGZ76_002994 [Entomortierella beljakovae]
MSDTSSTSTNSRRQGSTSSHQSQRRSGRQQQQTPQEELGFQIPPSSHFRSSVEELTFLRDSLKDIYEAVLLEDLIAAVEKSVDERLWRHVFYTPIEELRAELRKPDKDLSRRQETTDELSKLLDKGTGFYHELIMALRCDHGIDLGTVAVDILQSDSGLVKSKPTNTPDSKITQSQSRRNGRSRQQSRSKEETLGSIFSVESIANCIQKCFIYLGDIARYRTNIRLETQAALATAQLNKEDSKLIPVKPTASDWEAAHRFYTRAIQIFPDSGKPYGQLAILASYASDDLDALYWYTLSLGAKCPSVIVRDNLKVFFSRYQNRYRDLLNSICPQQQTADSMSTDEDIEIQPKPKVKTNSIQQSSLARCDITVLFIKIQMDLFAPHLESTSFSDPKILGALNQKLLSKWTTNEGFETSIQKMVASMILIVYDLHARTSISPLNPESTTKEGTLGLRQAQIVGLIYLLGIVTTVLEHQTSLLKQDTAFHSRLSQDLLIPTQMLIEFWLSHWDQIWGMIRLEDKWAGASELSLKKTTVTFFRQLVCLINIVCSTELEHSDPAETSQKALNLLQSDRCNYFGLLPFRRFHSQLSVCFDVVEDAAESRFSRFLLFADKVIQSSESIRGTIVELSTEVDETGVTQYKVMDAEDKRSLREKGSKMLASHWLQDQVTSLQKGLESNERKASHFNQQENQQSRRDNPRPRALVPLSMLPGTVKLPLIGQTRITDHYHRGTSRAAMAAGPNHGRAISDRNQMSKGQSEKGGSPRWICVVDFSTLVWRLSDIRILLDHRQCLIILPLDVLDQLDQAKKGSDKANQKSREAIRFLDEKLNMVQRGMSEPLLVAQNVKDTLGRWSEAVQYLIPEKDEIPTKVWDRMNDHTMKAADETDDDVVMTDAPSVEVVGNTSKSTLQNSSKDTNKGHNGNSGVMEDIIIDDDDDDEEEEVEEIEVRNAMNVPRIWRPILDACLFILRKREKPSRVAEDRFMLLTEDTTLARYAEWFDIPSNNVQDWKHNNGM